MGSVSQLFRDTALESSTEEWENGTESYASTQAAVLWTVSDAESRLRWVWSVHVYGMAGLFSALCVLCLLTALRLNAQLSERPHLASLNVFLGALAAARTIVLFADPYGSTQVLPAVLLQVLWDLGFPCLMSGFALLQLSFVRTTQLHMTPLNEEVAVAVFITLHFCLIITVGVLSVLQHSLKVIWMVTHIAFLSWGIVLSVSCLYCSIRLLRSIVKVPLHFLRQVDPGYEISSVMPSGLFTAQSPEEGDPRGQLPPRIRITDVGDSHSCTDASATGILMTPPREAYPLNCLPSSPGPWRTSDAKSKPTSPNEDPALFKPLIAIHPEGECHHKEMIQVTVSTLHSPSQPMSPMQPSKSKPARVSRSRLEKHLRRMAVLASMGSIICLLKAVEIYSHAGPISFMPWFCLQTLGRILEFTMAYSMVSMSQQSLHNHYYHYQ